MRRKGRNHGEKQAENADFERIAGNTIAGRFEIYCKRNFKPYLKSSLKRNK